MLQPHPVFETPEEDQIVWRYLDIGRYLALLSSSCLHFTRADRFEDKWEGEYPALTRVALRQVGALHGDPHLESSLCGLGRSLKLTTFVSCWHESDHESAAMWRLYGHEGVNLAVVSTIGRLRKALEDEKDTTVYCGRVKYLDYAVEGFSATNTLRPFLRKRRSFAYESEVRLISMLEPPQDTKQASQGADIPTWVPPKRDFKYNGLDLKISLGEMVQQVLVSPKAADWYVNVVKEVTAKYGLSKDLVVRSDIDEGPLT